MDALHYGLSLDPSHWHGLRTWVSAKHESAWIRVKLRELDADSVPNSAGVYVMTVRALRDVWQELSFDIPVYVGRSGNLRGRFLQHAKGSSTVAPIVACFGDRLDFWHTTADDSQDLEALLIGCLRPPGNRREERSIRVRILKPVPAGKVSE